MKVTIFYLLLCALSESVGFSPLPMLFAIAFDFMPS